MSSDYNQHILLHRLDDPLRILYWTTDEAMVLLGSPLMGIAIEHPLLGVAVAALSFWLLRKLKSSLGKATLKHAFYWYLPHNKKQLKKTPPSYQREYVG